MPRILAVDDEPNIVRLIQVNLERDGYTVETANNGAQALAKIRQSRPDLLVSDVMMPEMDGFEFIRQLRTRDDWKLIPVIVVTAKDLTAEERGVLNGHVSQILQKGDYDRNDLLEEVSRLVITRMGR